MKKIHHFGIHSGNPSGVFLVQLLQHDIDDRRDIFFVFTQRRASTAISRLPPSCPTDMEAVLGQALLYTDKQIVERSAIG